MLLSVYIDSSHFDDTGFGSSINHTACDALNVRITLEGDYYGAAIVLDRYGKLIKVYDGANLGFYQGNGKETAHFTTANYATVAFSELGEGEILIIFANDGGSNAARGFALGLRTDGSIGQVATLTGFTFAE